MLAWVLVCLNTAIGAEIPLDLDDPWTELSFARSLQQREAVGRDEVAVALHRLADDPVVGDQALDELYHLAVTEDVRPGWRDLYDTLRARAGQRSADGRLLLSLRSAQARVDDPGTRPQAVKTLLTLSQRHPERDDVKTALARSLLANDRADQAEPLFAAVDSGAANEGLLLSLLALNRLDEAKDVVRAIDMAKSHPLAKAVSNGSLTARIGALIEAGYVDTAAKVLGRFDTDAKDRSAWRSVAGARLTNGEPDKAAELFAKLVKGDPTSSTLRKSWVSALLEANRGSEAERAAGDNEEATQLVYAVQLVTTANEPVLERVDEIERAYRLAPDQPAVVLQRAELLLAQGRSKEARAVLEPAMVARPRAAQLQGVFDRAALKSGDPQALLSSHRQSLRRSTPYDFWFKVSAVAGMHTLMAEHLKERDDYDEAVFHYRAALALQPDNGGYYKGLGGTLWAAGRLDAGRAAYLKALEIDSVDIDALRSAVRIMLAANDSEGAQDLLDRTDLRSPAARELRQDVSVALLLADIEDALESGLETDVRAAFQDLLVRYPDNPRILHALGDTLMRYGKPADALAVYQRARTQRPSDPWLAMAEATALVQLKRAEEALPILESLADIDDDAVIEARKRIQADALRTEGDRLWHDVGRGEAAFDAYSKALDLHPGAWTMVSLAGLYLEHRQPGVALAFFDAALDQDPSIVEARLGRVTALQQLGQIDEARDALDELGKREAGAAVFEIQDSMEIQQALRDVDALALEGDFRRARKILDDISVRYPESPHVDAAMGSLMLVQGQPGVALKRAERALANDPTHGRALAVAMDAGLRTGRMDEVVQLMEAALDNGGGEPARTALENALFASSVEHAVELSTRGRRRMAEQELGDLRVSVSDNPDHWALLGGGYLALELTVDGLDVYERSLEFDPDHVPSIIGKSIAMEAMGNLRPAGRFLKTAYERIPDPRIGIALAEVQGRLGRWNAGVRTLKSVRDGTLGTSPEAAPRRRVQLEALPVLPLPDGTTPEDVPPLADEGMSGRVTLAEVDELEETLSANHYPYGDVGGGFIGRTGTEGENLLNSGVLGLAVSEFYAGPLRLEADVLSILVDDGVNEQLGVSAAVGIATPERSKVGLEAKVGTSPLGFEVGNYLTWLGSIKVASGPYVTFGADTGRTPVTDSLLSWAGLVDATTSQSFGLASNTWGGGFVSLANPKLTDAGVRFRVGYVEALSMDRVGRQELSAWGGQALGSESLQVRVGGNFTWLSHDRQVDRFVLGSTGIFSPRSYTVGLVRGSVRWKPNYSGTELHATGAIGVQSMTGEASPYFQPGVFRAFGLGAGLRFALTDDGWRIGLDAQNETTGNFWSQTTVMFRLGFIPEWTGIRSFKPLSSIHGTGIGALSVVP
ncbi:MAG: tetratricopeptide repeat protein [Myxococcota bacterium]